MRTENREQSQFTLIWKAISSYFPQLNLSKYKIYSPHLIDFFSVCVATEVKRVLHKLWNILDTILKTCLKAVPCFSNIISVNNVCSVFYCFCRLQAIAWWSRGEGCAETREKKSDSFFIPWLHTRLIRDPIFTLSPAMRWSIIIKLEEPPRLFHFALL